MYKFTKNKFNVTVLTPPQHKSLRRAAYLLRPLSQIQRAAVELQDDVAPVVIALLSSCGPAAIIRRVRAVIVSTFQRQGLRLRPHILKEIIEAFQPPIANRNASPAVVFEGVAVLVKASLAHTVPDRILSSAGSTVGASPVTKVLATPATTGRCVAVSEFVHADNVKAPTVANALPSPSPSLSRSYSALLRRFSLYEKSAESLSGKVEFILQKMAHTLIITINTGGWLHV